MYIASAIHLEAIFTQAEMVPTSISYWEVLGETCMHSDQLNGSAKKPIASRNVWHAESVANNELPVDYIS